MRWLGAELELAAQQPQAALRALGDASLRGDVPRPQLLLAGQALLATGQAQPVAERLQTWVVTHPHDAAAWRLLSQAWQTTMADPVEGRWISAAVHLVLFAFIALYPAAAGEKPNATSSSR